MPEAIWDAQPEAAAGPLTVDGSPYRPADLPATWQPTWQPKTNTLDVVVTSAAAVGALLGGVIPPQSQHWRGGVLLDEQARDLLRLSSSGGRYGVRDASDVGLSLLTTWPFLVDALISAWWYRGNAEVARKMALLDAQALAIAGAAQGLTTGFASRERPYGRLCGTEIPEQSVDCTGNVRYRSFFSGHATLSFTSAGLICVNHMKMGLLGAPGDALSCVVAYGVATTTATFRIMADMHYLSDVATGALIGTLVGVGVPLIHGHDISKEDGRRSQLEVRIVPVGQGLGLGGVF